MTRQQLILVAIAAISLSFGLTRFPSLSEPVEPSLNATGVDDKAGAPSGTRPAVPAAAGQGVTAPARNPEWPTMHAGASDEPPVDLGEPLNADTGDVRKSILFSADPIDIGHTLDADDPLAYGDEPSGPSNNIGEPLDADDPKVLPMPGEDPVNIGPDIDADDLWGWELYEGVSSAIEIGLPLDAGTPMRH